MIHVKKEGLLLKKTALEFEKEGVLNPAAIRVGDQVHLFYRAVKTGNFSSIGHCLLDGPLTITKRLEKPLLEAEFDYESHGVEDARIVKIDGTYYLTYTAYDGINARGALAVSPDLERFRKRGLLVPYCSYAEFASLTGSQCGLHENYFHQESFYLHENNQADKVFLWDKNLIFFPRRINGKLAFLHRIRPGIQLVMVERLEELTSSFWENYFSDFQKHIVMDPQHKHEFGYIGGGCPPIETPDGWILIYHGVEYSEQGLIYSACAALLDLENPVNEIARLPYPLFRPEHDWEIHGEVNNVVFPTGTAIFGNTLFIYYGAADSAIACASVNLPALIHELISQKNSHEN